MEDDTNDSDERGGHGVGDVGLVFSGFSGGLMGHNLSFFLYVTISLYSIISGQVIKSHRLVQ